jgi:hypothetical protein
LIEKTSTSSQKPLLPKYRWLFDQALLSLKLNALTAENCSIAKLKRTKYLLNFIGCPTKILNTCRRKKQTKEGTEFSLVKHFTRVIMGPSAV